MTSATRHLGSMQITTPGDRDILVTRAFNAPRHLVYQALTVPALVKRWLGVHDGWMLEVCEIDLRVGGAYRYVWRGPNMEMGMGGFYREIIPLERLVTSETFDQSWYPGEAIGTLVLTAQGEQTRMTLTITYDSKEARDAVLATPMADGMSVGYDKLEAELIVMMETGELRSSSR